jgi:predicted CoA-binding protein
MMRATRDSVDRFVSGRTLALVGVSAKGRGFGSAAYKELKARGYRVLAVHPSARAIHGEPCWPSLAKMPERVERLLVSVKPDRADLVVRDAAAAGVRQIWFQQGSESPAALETCRSLGLAAVHGQCILMFAEPVGSVHKLHRWVLKLFGRLPG